MSNLIIINGFFRSGTTFLWRVIRDSSDYVCFYEPLHPNLEQFVTDKPSIHMTHGAELWNEYRELNELEKSKLFSLNKVINGGQPASEQAIKYLEFLSELRVKVLLQPNRASLLLHDVLNFSTDAKVIHILRDPFEVWESMCKMAIYRGRYIFIKRYFPFFAFIRGFELFKAGRDVDSFRNVSNFEMILNCIRFFGGKHYLFRCFLRIWIQCNYSAIKAVEQQNGIIVSLENLITSKSLQVGVSKYLEIDLEFELHEPRCPVPATNNYDLIQEAKKLELSLELDYILRYLKNEF